MLLRESGKQDSIEFDLNVVVGSEVTLGLEYEKDIIQLTDAVCRGNDAELHEIRLRSVEAMGAQKTADVVMVAAGFSGITKIANGTGLHLDPETEAATTDLRSETGIDNYSESAKSNKFDH